MGIGTCMCCQQPLQIIERERVMRPPCCLHWPCDPARFERLLVSRFEPAMREMRTIRTGCATQIRRPHPGYHHQVPPLFLTYAGSIALSTSVLPLDFALDRWRLPTASLDLPFPDAVPNSAPDEGLSALPQGHGLTMHREGGVLGRIDAGMNASSGIDDSMEVVLCCAHR